MICIFQGFSSARQVMKRRFSPFPRACAHALYACESVKLENEHPTFQPGEANKGS